MASAVGLVVPAYRPDVGRLATYVDSLRAVLDPTVVRIELDAADAELRQALGAVDADVHAVPSRRGKGAAITDGFEALDTDVLAFADADGSTPAASLRAVLGPVTEDRADLAVGSRRHPDARVTSHQTSGRRFMGDVFAVVARRLLEVPIHDFQCGAKAITAEGWTSVREDLTEPGFAWDLELVAMASARDLSIAEVPIEWDDQPGSTVSPVRDALRLGLALLRSRHRAKRLRDDRLHTAIATTRPDPTALVDEE